MFSEEFVKYTEEKYAARLPLFGELSKEIERTFETLNQGEIKYRNPKQLPAEKQTAAENNKFLKNRILLMKFLYATMPLRDAGEYDFSVFLSYVDHALMLKESMPWCMDLPEDLFLHYVLYYRINTEDINPCRTFFYQQLKDMIFEKTMEEAILEVNYWCAEQASYAASDERTLSPMGVYLSGTGRCGEESTFTVSALRSVGIPARQVYAPWWTHCDDNHAWVEAYANGRWHFLGACEPEEVLNKGWFLGAASRALLIHSRTFFDYWVSGKRHNIQYEYNDYIGKEGSVYYFNSTPLYAKTHHLRIQVLDREDIPAGSAEVLLEVMNMAEYKKLAKLTTNEEGLASITIGFGDIHISAYKDGWMGEMNYPVKNSETPSSKPSNPKCIPGQTEQNTVCIKLLHNVDENIRNILTNNSNDINALQYQMTIEAPTETSENQISLSKEQQEKGREKRKKAEEKRIRKLTAYFDEEKALKFPEEKEILEMAKGNFQEIFQFLSRNSNPERKAILYSLSKKDYKDVKSETLEAFLNNPYYMEEKDVTKYILCPRIYNEELSPYPPFIRSYFSDKQLEAFRKNPYSVWDYIQKNIKDIPEETYETLYSSPIGCLKLKAGTYISKKILFSAILRSIGIPARIRQKDMEPEIYMGEVPGQVCGRAYCKKMELHPEKKTNHKGTLLLSVKDGLKWIYHQTWTIGKLKGIRFETLNYDGISFENNILSLDLDEGVYRIITSSRIPNGNQHVSFHLFTIKEGMEKHLSLSMYESKTEDLLCSHRLPDFEITSLSGEICLLSDVINNTESDKENTVLAFLEAGQEPTEHVLNEMLSQKDLLKTLPVQILFILSNREDTNHLTLKEVLKELPGIQIFFDRDFNNRESVARSMYVDSEKLPLLLAAKKGMTGIYGCSGYNVGNVNLICKIVNLT